MLIPKPERPSNLLIISTNQTAACAAPNSVNSNTPTALAVGIAGAITDVLARLTAKGKWYRCARVEDEAAVTGWPDVAL